jgi:hypothetical protein
MKLFTQGRYATIASTAALVVALGGTSYAAGLVTSGDIKDGTIQTKDINPAARTSVKSVHNDSGTHLDSTKTVLSLNLKKGSYIVTAKGYGYSSSSYAECWITDQQGNAVDYSVENGSGTFSYFTLNNQAVVTLTSPGTVQYNCYSSDAYLYSKKLTTLRVASTADLTGPNVAKTGHAQHLVTAR